MPTVGQAHDPKKDLDNIERFKDPWGGDIKNWRVAHGVTGKVYLETNSIQRAHEALRKNKGATLTNLWSAHLSERLFRDPVGPGGKPKKRIGEAAK